MMIERLTMPDICSLEKLIPYIREDFRREYYHEDIPGINNLTLHYSWEYVGLEDEERIQNSWMLQVFIDEIQSFHGVCPNHCGMLNRMVEFIRENKFYTHSMKREFEVIKVEREEEVRRKLPSHQPAWNMGAVRGMQILGSLVNDVYNTARIPLSEMSQEEALSFRILEDRYGSIVARPPTATFNVNVES